MLKTLIRNRMGALGSFMLGSARTKKGASKAKMVGFGVLMIYVGASFAMSFGMLFDQLAEPFHMMNIDWMYFSFTGMIAFALMFLGSIFATQTQLYDAKDNELLLSMPIPPKYILASRMAMLLVFNYIFELLVILPAGVVYVMHVPVRAGSVIFFGIEFLFLPLLAFAVAGLFGWGLALVSSKVRNKSLVTMILSLAFLAAYFYGYSKLNTYIQSLVANGSVIAEQIKGVALPVYWLGNAIATQNALHLLFSVLCMIVPFTAVYAVLSATFIKVITTKRGFTKVRYEEKSMKAGTAASALFRKELQLFISCPGYMMNAALGVVFILVAAGALVVKQDLISLVTAGMPDIAPYIGPAAIFALCLINSMVIISAPSISLEGSSLWIAQSIPVPAGDILLAKVKLHLAISLPAVVAASVVFSCVLRPGFIMMICMLLVPAFFTVFCALLGVALNLKFPKFDWVSETQAVKQGISTLIAMFGSAAAVLAPGMVYLKLLSDKVLAEVYMIGYGVLLAAACLILYRWLMTRGARIFETLQ
ncbi:hypothetical protein [Anaerobium acetethylicum]|uniref:ABC-2 type transport system permease protein n=1 Tax=Anaerobium acetethylicum TaxID=1619234 RepID=A0A1D3TYX6_9FIRM|nr:hypothetical protein [Anaerobium acetethylicum]SCP99684.1 ABC-2 type transport system permease protein [Anaerobium acetethylicum]